MNRIENEIYSYYKNNEFITICFDDLSKTTQITNTICKAANNDTGIKTVLLFGVTKFKEKIGIKENEKIIKSVINSIMIDIKPEVKFELFIRYDPTLSKSIAILIIIPTYMRFFYPHQFILFTQNIK
ncbi:MAG: hypothetical protein OEY49_11120, partial [Candidatus Heimdallarchaeota archaeon]|nr:hypothetical protein [Candidatus Heimdallarchaeota archaeon]